MAVFIDSAKTRGQPSARVIVAGILYVIYEYLSLLCVAIFGFIVFLRRNNLNAGEITSALILFLFALAYAIILFIGYKSSDRLGNILSKMACWMNRVLQPLFHRDLINPEIAYKFSTEIGDGIKNIREHKDKLFWPFLFALNNKAILICVLSATFLAMDTPFSVGTIIGGFSMVQLTYYVSPTPGGIGIVESVFPVILRMLRVPVNKGLLIALVYRAFTIWVPFLVGFISFRILQKKQGV